MAELDRLTHIKLNLANLEYERHGSTREDIAWLIEQLEAQRAEIGRLLSLLSHHNISPNDPGGRYTYGVIIANPPPDTP